MRVLFFLCCLVLCACKRKVIAAEVACPCCNVDTQLLTVPSRCSDYGYIQPDADGVCPVVPKGGFPCCNGNLFITTPIPCAFFGFAEASVVGCTPIP